MTHNEAILRLDALVQLAVSGREVTTPPEDPAEGDCWLVPAGATGDWAGQADAVAAWQDGAWAFIAPQAGWRVWVVDEAALLVWTGSAWEAAVPAPDLLQELSLLGLGTSADATNPFAAKLNKALWTARTVAEGGSGDLRYTLNKEAASNSLSLLMQTAWSGRAEIGLTGDDDLHVKVSPDGTAWAEALTIDRADGTVRFWEFEIGERRYGLPSDDEWGGGKVYNASTARLDRLRKMEGQSFLYTYDFGDSWEHEITVVSLFEMETGTRLPRLIDGQWRTPPEDVGGPPGFELFLEAMGDITHEDHENLLDWYGQDFDPADFEPEIVRIQLDRLAKQRAPKR